MTRRFKIALFLAALPAVLAGLLWIATFALGWPPDFVVFTRFSLAHLLLALGVGVSLVAGGFLAQAYLSSRREQGRLSKVQEQAAQRRRQFILRLDHELKNPLTAIQLEAANLAESGLEPGSLPAADSPPAAGPTSPDRRLQLQVQRLRDLTLTLRKLAELETRPIEFEPVDLDGLLNELVHETRLSPDGSARQLSLNLPAVPWRLPSVLGDADLLYLAFHNVLSNAVKFTRPGDAIQIRALEAGDGVIVEFADTGPGIPADEQAQVWDELFRGRQAAGQPGSGLGLPLVRTIIERHHGQSQLRSRIDQGTVVTLRIPTTTR